MKEAPLKIETIKLKDLAAFARHSAGDPTFEKVAPISILRAESQARNPQGDPDDIALILAIRKNRCVGYHGLLPGWLKYEDRISKIYWLVTFFLDEANRGKGYGKQLVAKIQDTDVDLVTTGITDGAAGVYFSAGFRELGELPYFQLRPQNWDDIKAVLRYMQPVPEAFTSKAVTRLTAEHMPPDTRRTSDISFLRDIKSVNWMIRNPWVVSSQDARKDVERYYFSRVRDKFEFIPLEIGAPDVAVRKGYLVLSISSHKNRTTLKVLDFYFFNPRDIRFAGYYALKYTLQYRADRLEFPSDLEPFAGKHIHSLQRLKRKKRRYLFYPRNSESPLALLADRIKLNYCDSDTAFT